MIHLAIVSCLEEESEGKRGFVFVFACPWSEGLYSGTRVLGLGQLLETLVLFMPVQL